MTDKQNMRMFAAELSDDLLKLDLHGLRPHEVSETIDQFLYSCFRKNESAIEIIYGVGTGAMEEAVLKFLEGHPLVESVQEKSGNCLVLLIQR